MSNTFIKGDNLIVYFQIEENYLPIGCLNGNDFEEDVETLDSTTADNNGWKTHRLTNQGYSFSFSGLLINTAHAKGDFTKISYDKLKELKRERTLVKWKIQDTEQIFVSSGTGYITNLSQSANVGEYVSFSASVLGQGKPEETSLKSYSLEDGTGKNIQDGNNNNIITA